MRYLLLDRIVEMQPGAYAVGTKCAAMTEDYFADHFPGFPVVPGVLIVEAMAQLAGRLITFTVAAERGERAMPVLLSIHNARFRHFVRPGDTMVIRTELLGMVEGAGRCKASAKVGETVVATAELMLGYDTGHGSTVVPEAAREILWQWGEQVNRNLLGDLPLPGVTGSPKKETP